ncbi:MAG TPA: lytic transglycosylase domain-containing protein [Candidatus Dormibacteraeota bacterium]|nr:lytic transglycosylase domain-containing protein [Candidatus Dormibacteraeota bacterium]
MAAGAIAVKQALTGPLAAAAQPELERVKQSLDEKTKPALTQAAAVLDQAKTEVTGVVVPASPPGSPTGTAHPRTQAAWQTHSGRVSSGIADEPPNGQRPYSRALLQKILREAAVRHGLDPKLVLALSYWESGWDQSRVSVTGAVGLMQVEPDTAQEAGPGLLGRPVNIDDPYDNADVGCAIFRAYLEDFKTPSMALAAYNQGPTSLRQNGILPDTQAYVDGIEALATQQNP